MFLVSIEGIDGSGKTTLAKEIVDRLIEAGRSAIYTKEPFTEKISSLIQELGWSDPIALTLLFSADRRIHVKWMEEQKVDVIITDRYIHSTIAYQSVMGVEESWIRQVNSVFPQPNLVILLDLDPLLANLRVKKNDLFDFPEKRKLFEEIRRKYLEMAGRDGFLVLDASKPLEEISNEAFTYLLGSLP